MDYPDPEDFLDQDDYELYESRFQDEFEMMEEMEMENNNTTQKKKNGRSSCMVRFLYVLIPKLSESLRSKNNFFIWMYIFTAYVMHCFLAFFKGSSLAKIGCSSQNLYKGFKKN